MVLLAIVAEGGGGFAHRRVGLLAHLGRFAMGRSADRPIMHRLSLQVDGGDTAGVHDIEHAVARQGQEPGPRVGMTPDGSMDVAVQGIEGGVARRRPRQARPRRRL